MTYAAQAPTESNSINEYWTHIVTDTDSIDPAARELYAEAIVIDGLNTSRWGVESVFSDLRTGGVTAINATCALWEGFEDAMDSLAAWFGWFDEFSDHIRHVRTVADIREAKAAGRTGIIFGWQNATPVENDIRRFQLFYELGVRIVQLTYNERNLFGNGCWERTDEGLSKIGRAAVREMNRVGILIDLSHVGDRTVLETIDHSEHPVSFTHANARSEHASPRNKTDEAIRSLVARGGVVGANSFPHFFPARFESTLDDFLDSIDYLVQMVGIDHVAIGTDFCMAQPRSWFEWINSSHGKRPDMEVPYSPDPYHHLRGFNDPTEFVNVAAGLLQRGYPPDGVRQVLGENWLRVFARVWHDDA